MISVLRKLAHGHIKYIKIYRNLSKDKIISAIMIRFLIEGYIDLFISALISIEMFCRLDIIMTNFSDIFAFISGFLFFLMLLSLPLLASWAITTKQKFMEISKIEP